MKLYLFDTDTFIFLLKRHPRVGARAQAAGFQTLALSAITVAEVLHGAYYSANPTRSLRLTRKLMSQFTVLDLDAAIARKFGKIKADLRRQGQLVADFDLLIAATALTSSRTLVTNNTRHFQRLSTYGLVLENWTV